MRARKGRTVVPIGSSRHISDTYYIGSTRGRIVRILSASHTLHQMAKPKRSLVCPVCNKIYSVLESAEKVSGQTSRLGWTHYLMHSWQHLRTSHPDCTQPLVIRLHNVPSGKRLCELCPHLPEFSSRAEKSQVTGPLLAHSTFPEHSRSIKRMCILRR